MNETPPPPALSQIPNVHPPSRIHSRIKHLFYAYVGEKVEYRPVDVCRLNLATF